MDLKGIWVGPQITRADVDWFAPWVCTVVDGTSETKFLENSNHSSTKRAAECEPGWRPRLEGGDHYPGCNRTPSEG